MTSPYKVYFVFAERESQAERGKVRGFCIVSIRSLLKCHVWNTWSSIIDQLMDCEILLMLVPVSPSGTLEDFSTIPHSARIEQGTVFYYV